ncbi:MAG: hypothetical protein QGF06_06995 [Acidimicrobiales bacterium]|jgi:hypothetical protein|nr:hypothetical protein [Acidimicrobiaceae bacterium]MDP6323655.1 hypothetical protein [Acidimicrobiales bacterium]MDP6893876.1 hypothetical protein [Acidimicrobiales bacterium]|tara:strand:+ start:60 stop:332 length:273 start_codon:yes stop_codon:yes gene_type:complete
MSNAETNFTTIKFSPDCEIEEISRVALAAILRIHKIDPAVVSELAVSLQQELTSISTKTPFVEVEFQPSENSISAEVRANGDSRTISATW